MAKNREYWARKEHFERTGSWPETPKQRAAREEGPTEAAHPVVSSAQLDQVSKVVEAWHKANPGFR